MKWKPTRRSPYKSGITNSGKNEEPDYRPTAKLPENFGNDPDYRPTTKLPGNNSRGRNYGSQHNPQQNNSNNSGFRPVSQPPPKNTAGRGPSYHKPQSSGGNSTPGYRPASRQIKRPDRGPGYRPGPRQTNGGGPHTPAYRPGKRPIAPPDRGPVYRRQASQTPRRGPSYRQPTPARQTESSDETGDQRRYQRMKMIMGMVCRRKDRNDVNVFTDDVSAGGIKFTCQAPLEKDEEVALDVPIGNGEYKTIPGRIAWIKKETIGIEGGIEFFRMDEGTKSEWSKFIQRNAEG